MARKTDTLDFSELIDAEECKQLIANNVAELSLAHQELAAAQANPQPLDPQTLALFEMGPHGGWTTVHLAASRVGYLEAAQNRLWAWWKKIQNGEAGRP